MKSSFAVLAGTVGFALVGYNAYESGRTGSRFFGMELTDKYETKVSQISDFQTRQTINRRPEIGELAETDTVVSYKTGELKQIINSYYLGTTPNQTDFFLVEKMQRQPTPVDVANDTSAAVKAMKKVLAAHGFSNEQPSVQFSVDYDVVFDRRSNDRQWPRTDNISLWGEAFDRSGDLRTILDDAYCGDEHLSEKIDRFRTNKSSTQSVMLPIQYIKPKPLY